jgi:hypothetical protein
MNTYWHANQNDIAILRELVKRKREISQDPLMAERRTAWLRHNELDSPRAMILAETGGVLDELVPLGTLRCSEAWARAMERELRELIYRCEQVKDDWVVEPRLEYGWLIDLGTPGVEHHVVRGQNEGRLGSYHWDPPIADLERDFGKLRFRCPTVDREKTHAWAAFLEEHFGDILPPVLRRGYWWTTGLTWEAINLVGLEPFMLAMHDNPRGLHRLMAFLRDDFTQVLDWFEGEGLLTLNNENDYVGSGSIGYATSIPRNGNGHAAKVTAADLWGLSESQETVGVSPRMFEEFVFPYQLPIISRFGLSYYGCCEPVHNRIHIIKRIPNLRKVSVSPWCDQEKLADALGGEIIFCRKPNPTLISTSVFDEDAIRADLRQTVRAAQGCALELAMKDVHTLADQPWRLGRWVELAREESAG